MLIKCSTDPDTLWIFNLQIIFYSNPNSINSWHCFTLMVINRINNYFSYLFAVFVRNVTFYLEFLNLTEPLNQSRSFSCVPDSDPDPDPVRFPSVSSCFTPSCLTKVDLKDSRFSSSGIPAGFCWCDRPPTNTEKPGKLHVITMKPQNKRWAWRNVRVEEKCSGNRKWENEEMRRQSHLKTQKKRESSAQSDLIRL